MIHEHLEQFEVAMMCEPPGVSRAGYYDRVGRPLSPLSAHRAQIVAAIRLAHVESRCRYGSPDIHRDLLEKGLECRINTVAGTMKDHGIQSCVSRRFRVTTTDSNHPHPVFDNRLDRDFTATGRNRKWAADITPGDSTRINSPSSRSGAA